MIRFYTHYKSNRPFLIQKLSLPFKTFRERKFILNVVTGVCNIVTDSSKQDKYITSLTEGIIKQVSEEPDCRCSANVLFYLNTSAAVTTNAVMLCWLVIIY